MPIIRIWFLPWAPEELIKLHRNMIEAVVGIKELGLGSTNEITISPFPLDMSVYRPEKGIIVDVTGEFKGLRFTEMIRERLAKILGDTVYAMFPFPKVTVEYFLYQNDPRTGSWHYRPYR